ncbi:MAG: hypothetical protein HAW67_04795 [Endozoicomonadaceae bacterium]|nr:hypothetical protein [Endozoicomonadaceae bacterium]
MQLTVIEDIDVFVEKNDWLTIKDYIRTNLIQSEDHERLFISCAHFLNAEIISLLVNEGISVDPHLDMLIDHALMGFYLANEELPTSKTENQLFEFIDKVLKLQSGTCSMSWDKMVAQSVLFENDQVDIINKIHSLQMASEKGESLRMCINQIINASSVKCANWLINKNDDEVNVKYLFMLRSIKKGNEAMVHVGLQNPADIAYYNNRGGASLFTHSLKLKEESISYALLNAAIDITDSAVTCLKAAARSSSIDLLKLIFEKGDFTKTNLIYEGAREALRAERHDVFLLIHQQKMLETGQYMALLNFTLKSDILDSSKVILNLFPVASWPQLLDEACEVEHGEAKNYIKVCMLNNELFNCVDANEQNIPTNRINGSNEESIINQAANSL